MIADHLRALAEAVVLETLTRCARHNPYDDLPAGLIENIALRIMQHNAEQLGMTKHDFRTVVDTPGTSLNEIEEIAKHG